MSSIYDQLGDACKQFGKRVGMAIKEANDLMATNGRREREMSKYVIELDEDVKILQSISVTQHGNAYTNTKWVANLEELNSDYINEHFGELQDEAYQAGLNDAWEAARKIIRMPDGDILDLFPDCYASVCTAVQAILKYDASEAIAKLKAYEDTQKDRIEVGDEVISDTGNKFTVTGFVNSDDVCGFSERGLWCFNTIDKLTKTGKHYNLASILEAMKS